jgi:parallel beta-helix repeat protein
MKKTLILVFLGISWVASATNYYVNNAGQDNNTGLSDSLAWKTLAKVNAYSFSPGDTVFFKRDNKWFEGRLSPKTSGTSGSPIVFTAYGTGAKPVISGYIKYNGWKTLKTNIYYVTGIYQTESLCLFDGITFGYREYTIANLNKPHEFRTVFNFPPSSNDTLFIYTITPADTDNVVLAKGTENIDLVNKSYINIEKLKLQYSGGHCINLTKSSYISIDSCNISWGAFQGINCAQSSNIKISNNIIENNGSDGIYYQYSDFANIYNNVIGNNGYNPVGGDQQALGFFYTHDINLYNNKITHDAFGSVIEASSYPPDEAQYNWNIYNNTLIANGVSHGVFAVAQGTFNIYNNVVTLTTDNKTNVVGILDAGGTYTVLTFHNNTIVGDGGTQVIGATINDSHTGKSFMTVKNNIFYNVGLYYKVASAMANDFISDNNLYLDDSGFKFLLGSPYNFTNWKTISGEDANSKIGYPLFINAAKGDYRLAEASPARDAGASVGISYDIVGNPRDTKPDIGAYEYISGAPNDPNPNPNPKPNPGTDQSEIFDLYPNPNDGHFSIDITSYLAGEKNIITIVNSSGQTVYSGILTKEEYTRQFDLSHFASGNYSLIITSDNIIMAVKKFIKV